MIRRQLAAAASHLVPSLADVARASLCSGLASPKIHAAVTAPASYYVSGFSSFHARAALVDTCSPYTTPCYSHHHVHRQQPLRLSLSLVVSPTRPKKTSNHDTSLSSSSIPSSSYRGPRGQHARLPHDFSSQTHGFTLCVKLDRYVPSLVTTYERHTHAHIGLFATTV